MLGIESPPSEEHSYGPKDASHTRANQGEFPSEFDYRFASSSPMQLISRPCNAGALNSKRSLKEQIKNERF